MSNNDKDFLEDDFENEGESEEFDLIVLEDDETGENIELVIIDEWEENSETTYLLVVALPDFESECPDASIIKEFKDEGGEFVYEVVDNDEEFEKASEYFSSLEE